jgi:cell division protein FtsA
MKDTVHMQDDGHLLVGLDIGTTKICAIVAEDRGQSLDIIGIGTSPSDGLRKGVVINIEATVNSIKRAVEEAELMAGVEISNVYAGIAGHHIRSLNSSGVVAIRNQEVGDGDLARVLDAAQAVNIPMDREVIHIIPQEYIIDDQDGIREPVGMSGVRLTAKVHIVTAAVTSAQNIVRCSNEAGLVVNDIILEQLASSTSVLTDDEKDLGVMLVDIGGGTTDVAIFANGSVVHTAVLALGGDHLTHDIAYGLSTPTRIAESIKIEHGCAMASLVADDRSFEVPSVGGHKRREASRALLASIIEPRVTEMLELVRQELERSGRADLLPGGVVLTGGTSILAGITELAEGVFGLPARRGVPGGVGGLSDVVASPIYATGVGLVQFAWRNADDRVEGMILGEPARFETVKERMKTWLGHFF